MIASYRIDPNLGSQKVFVQLVSVTLTECCSAVLFRSTTLFVSLEMFGMVSQLGIEIVRPKNFDSLYAMYYNRT